MAEIDFRLRQPHSSLTKRHATYPFIEPSKYTQAHVGRVVLVTGGGRGLGKSMALAFANAGANIAILGRSQTHLTTAVSEIQAKGRKSIAIAGDITDPEVVGKAVKECVEKLGGIDILINNAGMGRFSSLAVEDMSIWWSVFELNVKALGNMIRAVLPIMISKGSGIIFNVASEVGVTGIPYATAYSASKSAVIKLSETLSWEVASRGIYVYSVHPGIVATGISATDHIFNHGEMATNETLKGMFDMIEEYQEDTAELSADSLVALATMEDSVAKVLNGRHVNCTRDIGELIEGVKSGKFTNDMAILSMREL